MVGNLQVFSKVEGLLTSKVALKQIKEMIAEFDWSASGPK